MHSKGKERRQRNQLLIKQWTPVCCACLGLLHHATPKKKRYIQTRKSKFKQYSKAQPKEKNHVIDWLRSSAAKSTWVHRTDQKYLEFSTDKLHESRLSILEMWRICRVLNSWKTVEISPTQLEENSGTNTRERNRKKHKILETNPQRKIGQI
jgi:hypothetical protein